MFKTRRWLPVLLAVALCPVFTSAAVVVSTVDALKAAFDQVNADPAADRTILLEAGAYRLKWSHLWIGRDGVTVASRSGDREAVVLQGQRGMRGGVIEFIFQVSADDITIRDLTLENVGSHAVIIQGEAPYDADRTTLRNLVIRDTFEQMVKIRPSMPGRRTSPGCRSISAISTGIADRVAEASTSGRTNIGRRCRPWG